MWPPGAPPHHLYVVVAGGRPHADHVLFRDCQDGLAAEPPELFVLVVFVLRRVVPEAALLFESLSTFRSSAVSRCSSASRPRTRFWSSSIRSRRAFSAPTARSAPGMSASRCNASSLRSARRPTRSVLPAPAPARAPEHLRTRPARRHPLGDPADRVPSLQAGALRAAAAPRGGVAHRTGAGTSTGS